MGNPFWSLPMDQWSSSLTPMPEPLFKPSQVISTPSSFHWRLPSLLIPSLSSLAPVTAESISGTLRTVRKFVFLTETIKTPCSVFSSTRNTWWWHQHAALCPSGFRPLRMKPSKSTRKLQTSLAEELKFVKLINRSGSS